MSLIVYRAEGSPPKTCRLSTRLYFDELKGLNLVFLWCEGFIERGPIGTNQHRYWLEFNSFFQNMHLYFGKIQNLVTKNPDNFALQLCAGAMILLLENEKRLSTDFGICISHLRTAYSKWKHPLVLIIMARVLELDHHNVASLRESLRIWKQLQRGSLIQIVKYLPDAQKGQERIRYERELRWDIKLEIANCYIALCRNRKKMRYLKRSLNLYESLSLHFIEYADHCSSCTILEKIKLITNQIRLLFWSGDYHSAYQSVTDLMSLCSKKKVKLDFHSARICYTVFFKLEKYTEWNHALKQQSREGLRSEEILDSQKSQWALLVVDVYRTFLSLKGVSQKKSFKDLYEDVVARYNIHSPGGISSGIIMEAFLALFEHEYSKYHGNLLPCGSVMWFKVVATLDIHRFLEHDGALNDCSDETLCVGMALNYSFLTQFVHYAVREYKMAHYFYQFYHEINPFDPAAFQHHGFLMQSAGKMERAEKYFERARKLNIRSKLDLESLGIGSVELNVFDYCSHCRKRGSGFKRCGRCKVTFYCSRKCQKLHWREEHKKQCIYREEYELRAAHKLLPFVGKLDTSQSGNRRVVCEDISDQPYTALGFKWSWLTSKPTR